jgi:hypothetical protein
LTSKLLPMKSNANNSELSNLLALVTANWRANGFELLHSLFKHCITAFNPDEVTI